jgi:Tfp pilus assembly protein PilX
MMKTQGFRQDRRRVGRGSVLLLVLFILALSAALVIGMLQLTTEEVLQLRNQMELARALCVSEAGLNDAIAEIREDVHWNTGFSGKAFYEDAYSVTVSGTAPSLTLVSTGTTSSGYAARLEAQIRADVNPPHAVTIQSIRINP